MRSMAIGWLVSFGCGLMISANMAAAQQGADPAPTLLELYTSQGCSSCPPADKLIKTYAERRDIVALSFNVDYWDYLGWKDTLAQRAFSDRQRTYAMKRGDGEVYTPQIVVNGLTHAVGSMPKRVDRAIQVANAELGKQKIPLTVIHSNGKLTVSVGGDQPIALQRSATVWLATVRSKVKVTVKRGENHGRTLTYYNVVHRLTPIGMWSGKKTVIELKDEDVLQGKADNCAVLVQLGKGGPVVAARWMSTSG